MPKEPEFAELYTQTEKIRFLAVGMLCGLATLLGTKLWLLPWFNHFVETAPCRSILGIDGLIVLWTGIFVGLPLSFSILMAFTLGRSGYKILRDQQFPSRNEKVYKPTKIQRGRSAQIIGYLHLCPFIFLFALSIWGSFQIKDMPKQTAQDTKLNCEKQTKSNLK
jgi:hypothetical protein